MAGLMWEFTTRVTNLRDFSSKGKVRNVSIPYTRVTNRIDTAMNEIENKGFNPLYTGHQLAQAAAGPL